jgi:ferritin-like metal-binding protein YciE
MSESLQDLFTDELRDAYDAEKQLVKALKQLANAATNPQLTEAFTAHREETIGQIETLESVFQMLELRPRGKHCPGIAGIIEESKDAINERDPSPVLDVALVGGGRRAEHYEIAAYTLLVDLARTLGYDEAVPQLQSILDQEMSADAKLAALGEEMLSMAMEGDIGEEDEGQADGESDDQPAPSRKKTPLKTAAKKSGSNTSKRN